MTNYSQNSLRQLNECDMFDLNQLNVSEINNLYNLLAFLSLLFVSLIFWLIRNKYGKTSSTLDPNFQDLIKKLSERCSKLEKKAEENQKDIEGWFNKYYSLEKICDEQRSALTNIVEDQAEQINKQAKLIRGLQAKVKKLEASKKVKIA